MAKVTVKLFGVLRVDTKLATEELNIGKIEEIFPRLNARVDEIYAENLKTSPNLEKPAVLSYKDVIVFINGERCKKKSAAVSDGDEIWILSPASGG